MDVDECDIGFVVWNRPQCLLGGSVVREAAETWGLGEQCGEALARIAIVFNDGNGDGHSESGIRGWQGNN
jgi:hypothetical protein